MLIAGKTDDISDSCSDSSDAGNSLQPNSNGTTRSPVIAEKLPPTGNSHSNTNQNNDTGHNKSPVSHFSLTYIT